MNSAAHRVPAVHALPVTLVTRGLHRAGFVDGTHSADIVRAPYAVCVFHVAILLRAGHDHGLDVARPDVVAPGSCCSHMHSKRTSCPSCAQPVGGAPLRDAERPHGTHRYVCQLFVGQINCGTCSHVFLLYLSQGQSPEHVHILTMGGIYPSEQGGGRGYWGGGGPWGEVVGDVT